MVHSAHTYWVPVMCWHCAQGTLLVLLAFSSVSPSWHHVSTVTGSVELRGVLWSEKGLLRGRGCHWSSDLGSKMELAI